jgi:hypothetical protein
LLDQPGVPRSIDRSVLIGGLCWLASGAPFPRWLGESGWLERWLKIWVSFPKRQGPFYSVIPDYMFRVSMTKNWQPSQRGAGVLLFTSVVLLTLAEKRTMHRNKELIQRKTALDFCFR